MAANLGGLIVLIACFGFARSQTITVSPASPITGQNCIPFGDTVAYGFSGFVYNNIPAFKITPGDKISFDLGLADTTIADICRAIYFSVPTTALPACNTGPLTLAGWTLVAAMQCTGGQGDSIVGNWDITFTTTANFNFLGGQLVIGVMSDGTTYTDGSCTQVRLFSLHFSHSFSCALAHIHAHIHIHIHLHIPTHLVLVLNDT